MKTEQPLIALLSLAVWFLLYSSAASSKVIEFEGGTKPALENRPFIIEAPDGTIVNPSTTATFKHSAEEVKRRLREQRSVNEVATSDGYLTTLHSSSEANREYRTTAGEYAKALGRAEVKLNNLGFSLRSDSDIATRQTQSFEASKMEEQVNSGAEIYLDIDETTRSVSDDGTIRNHTSEESVPASPPSPTHLYLASSASKCVSPRANETEDDYQLRCFLGKEIDTPTRSGSPTLEAASDTNCGADAPIGVALLAYERWNDGGGDQNFGWGADAIFKIATDSSGLAVEALAKANATAFSYTKDVIEASAGFQSPRFGAPNAAVKMAVFGRSIFSQNETYQDNLASSRDQNKHERYSYSEETDIASTTFSVGFVPVSLGISARVDTGLTYQLNLAPISILGQAEVRKQIALLATAGVGADLDLFEILIGVKGYVDLIDASIGTYPKAGLELTSKKRPVIAARFDARAGMRTLAGKIDVGVWAKTRFGIPQPKSGWPFLEKKPFKYEWKTELANYPGYNFPGIVIFDHKIGYDICSGEKTIETLVANQPKPRDVRTDFITKESLRVREIENKIANCIDERLRMADVSQVERQTNEVLSKLTELGEAIDLFNNIQLAANRSSKSSEQRD